MILLSMSFRVPAAARRFLFRGKDGELDLNKVNAYYGTEEIAAVNRFPGLIWKVWAISSDGRGGSGYYLFDTLEHAELRGRYARKFYWRKGITGLRLEYLQVLEACSRGTRAPLDLPPSPELSLEEKEKLLSGSGHSPIQEFLVKYKTLKGV